MQNDSMNPGVDAAGTEIQQAAEAPSSENPSALPPPAGKMPRNPDRPDIFAVALISASYIAYALWSWSIATRSTSLFRAPFFTEDPVHNLIKLFTFREMIVQRISDAGLLVNGLSLAAGLAVLYGCTTMAKRIIAYRKPQAVKARPASFRSKLLQLDAGWIVGACAAYFVLAGMDQALPYGLRIGFMMLLSSLRFSI